MEAAPLPDIGLNRRQKTLRHILETIVKQTPLIPPIAPLFVNLAVMKEEIVRIKEFIVMQRHD